MSVSIKWDDFWPMVMAMPFETQQALADAFDFDDWLATKSPAVVFEVVRGMPVQAAFRYRGMLGPDYEAKLFKHFGLPAPARLPALPPARTVLTRLSAPA